MLLKYLKMTKNGKLMLTKILSIFKRKVYQPISCPDPHPELCSISLTRAQSTLKIIKQHSSLRVRLTFLLSHTSFKSSTHGLMKLFFSLGKSP